MMFVTRFVKLSLVAAIGACFGSSVAAQEAIVLPGLPIGIPVAESPNIDPDAIPLEVLRFAFNANGVEARYGIAPNVVAQIKEQFQLSNVAIGKVRQTQSRLSELGVLNSRITIAIGQRINSVSEVFEAKIQTLLTPEQRKRIRQERDQECRNVLLGRHQLSANKFRHLGVYTSIDQAIRHDDLLSLIETRLPIWKSEAAFFQIPGSEKLNAKRTVADLRLSIEQQVKLEALIADAANDAAKVLEKLEQISEPQTNSLVVNLNNDPMYLKFMDATLAVLTPEQKDLFKKSVDERMAAFDKQFRIDREKNPNPLTMIERFRHVAPHGSIMPLTMMQVLLRSKPEYKNAFADKELHGLLKLSKQQDDQIASLLSEYAREQNEATQRNEQLQQKSREASDQERRDMVLSHNRELQAELCKILSADQVDTLKKGRWRELGLRALLADEVVEQLKLTPMQKQTIDELISAPAPDSSAFPTPALFAGKQMTFEQFKQVIEQEKQRENERAKVRSEYFQQLEIDVLNQLSETQRTAFKELRQQ